MGREVTWVGQIQTLLDVTCSYSFTLKTLKCLYIMKSKPVSNNGRIKREVNGPHYMSSNNQKKIFSSDSETQFQLDNPRGSIGASLVAQW